MWNHRDLNDPFQMKIEHIIKRHIPGYEYGSRRVDPTEVLTPPDFLSRLKKQGTFVSRMTRDDVITGWKSHASLARQANDKFADIIAEIASLFCDASTIDVPYTTCAWVAELIMTYGPYRISAVLD